jgi:hypothetical protein
MIERPKLCLVYMDMVGMSCMYGHRGGGMLLLEAYEFNNILSQSTVDDIDEASLRLV